MMLAKFRWLFAILVVLVSGCFDANAKPSICEKDFVSQCKTLNCTAIMTKYPEFKDFKSSCNRYPQEQRESYCKQLYEYNCS